MSIFASGDSVDAIVADIGSYATKIGQAGEDFPRAYFRSNVAVLREEEEEDGGSNTKKHHHRRRRRRATIEKVNYDALHRPAVYKASYNGNEEKDDEDVDGNWEVNNPVDPTTGLWYDPSSSNNNNNGSDWADLIPIFLQHGYSSSLGLLDMTANPLLLIERSYNPPPIRQQTLEILMEECNVPATFFGRDAIMACYSCGRTTSTVVDIGYSSGTTITPVYEGYVEQK
eukprot:scaffold16013_cov69-Cylindrotheca_fusiformis.AAC.1